MNTPELPRAEQGFNERGTRSASASWFALALLLLLSLAFNYPYLSGGFQADDILFINMLREHPLPYSRWLGAWSVAVDQFPGFTNLWWFEPGVRGSFFRPLPSLILEGSYRLFGENAFPLHLLSILLHGMVAFTLFLFFSRLTGRGFVALLAGLLFITCEDHSMSVGWIATMTDLLCVVFINLALLLHLRWRDIAARCGDRALPWDGLPPPHNATTRESLYFTQGAALESAAPNVGWGRGHPLLLAGSLLCQMLALACKETAVAAPVAIVLLEWFLKGGESAIRDRSCGFLKRSWPSAGLLIVYLSVYTSLGLGGMRNLAYLDPLSQPGAYVLHALTTLPVMFSAALSVIPPSLASFTPALAYPVALSGVVLILLFAKGLRPFRGDPVLRWSFALFIIALLPQVATDASERLLYFPLVPLTYPLACLMTSVPRLARRLRPCELSLQPFTRLWGWYVLLGILLPGLILSAREPHLYVQSLQRPSRDMLTSIATIRATLAKHPSTSIVILNTSGCFLTFYAGGIIEYHLGRKVPVYVLSSLNGKLTLERAGPRSMVLRTDRPGWLGNMFARIMRCDPHLSQGRVYRKTLFDSTLVQLTPDGQDVLAVRFDFHRPFDDPNLLFLAWNETGFAPIDLSALEAHKELPLVDTSDIWKSMM